MSEINLKLKIKDLVAENERLRKKLLLSMQNYENKISELQSEIKRLNGDK